MAVAIYFGKVNLISSQIGNALFNSASLRSILSDVINALKDDTVFTYTSTKQIDETLTVTENIEYSLSVKEKTDSDIQGYLHKKSYLYYKDFNKHTKV